MAMLQVGSIVEVVQVHLDLQKLHLHPELPLRPEYRR